MKKTPPNSGFERPTLASILSLGTKVLVSEVFNSLLLLMKQKRVYQFDSKKFRGVNLGSSTSCPENWLGISGGIAIFFLNLPKFIFRAAYVMSGRAKKAQFNEFYKSHKSTAIIHHNLLYGIPFRDASIPYLYSSHFFEHLSPSVAKFLAKESFRVLIPGGYIRIVVPSLDKEVAAMMSAIEKYQNDDSNLIQRFVTVEEAGYIDSFSRHRAMYNFKSMRALLEDAGFTDVSECKKKNGSVPDLDKLDIREGLLVEARKSVSRTVQS